MVDDYIPCLNGTPAFSKANGPELWVLLLEKVWAKLKGSYHAAETGNSEEVLYAFCGCPSVTLLTYKPTLWFKMREAAQKK